MYGRCGVMDADVDGSFGRGRTRDLGSEFSVFEGIWYMCECDCAEIVFYLIGHMFYRPIT